MFRKYTITCVRIHLTFAMSSPGIHVTLNEEYFDLYNYVEQIR